MTEMFIVESLEDLAETARYHAEAGDAAAQRAVNHWIEAGRCLNRAKELVEHGAWGDWLTVNWPKSERTAQLYMQLARRYDSQALESATVADLEGVRDAIVKLLAKEMQVEGNPILSEILVERVEVGEISVKQAQRLQIAINNLPNLEAREEIVEFATGQLVNADAVEALALMATNAPDDFEVLLASGYLQVGEEVIAAGELTARDLARAEAERQREDYLKQLQATRQPVILSYKTTVVAAIVNDCLTVRIDDIGKQLKKGDVVFVTLEKEVGGGNSVR